MIENAYIGLFGMALSLVVFCSSCERSEQGDHQYSDAASVNGDVNEKPVESPPAVLEIFPESGGPALSDPLNLLGILVTPEQKLIMVLDQDAKSKMKEVTSVDNARNSLLTVKVNGMFIDDQRNENGWTGGVVLSGLVSDDLLNELRSQGIKIVEIEQMMFMYESYVEALNAE